MKYKVNRIRSDIFRIYPNRRQGGYDVKSIHTTVPRMCRTFDEAVSTMHVLLDLKHEVLPGAFINQTRRNHPRKIRIRGLKHFRIKYLSVRCMDQMQPNWRIYDLEEHKAITFLDSEREVLKLLHTYFDRSDDHEIRT